MHPKGDFRFESNTLASDPPHVTKMGRIAIWRVPVGNEQSRKRQCLPRLNVLPERTTLCGASVQHSPNAVPTYPRTTGNCPIPKAELMIKARHLFTKHRGCALIQIRRWWGGSKFYFAFSLHSNWRSNIGPSRASPAQGVK